MFDEADRVIVSELQRDGRTSLADIGRKLGVSHVAVRKRLKRLVKNGLTTSRRG